MVQIEGRKHCTSLFKVDLDESEICKSLMFYVEILESGVCWSVMPVIRETFICDKPIRYLLI